MSEATAKEKGYIRIPYEFFSEGFTLAGVLILGKIFTFSTLKNVKDSICRSSFRDFARDFGLSERQVARKVKSLKKGDLIAQDKSLRACASYTYTGEKCEKAFIRSDLYLYQEQFEIKGEGKRYLTIAEILVLSLMMTHCGNPKSGRFTGSVRSIAKILSLSASTVQRCLSALKRANLISCPAEDKSPNGSRRSVFHVNGKLLKKTEKAYKETVKVKEYVDPEVARINAKADRERFYSHARERAEAPARQARERLQADLPYRVAERSWNDLKIPQARAEISGDVQEQKRISQEQTRWRAVMAERMAALSISPEDLKPRFRCRKCSDTGFKPDGIACDCYPGDGQK